MTKKNDDMTAGEAIKRLQERDDEPNNESARRNEALAAKAGTTDKEAVEDSIRANDPSLSRAAHTSAKSGFNEDLDRDDEAPEKGRAAKSQTKAVQK